ncbi:unnamed protein product, partial [Ectocarpus fasciculatus]
MSTQAGHLTPEEIRRFHENGYFIKKAGLMGAEGSALSEYTDQAIETACRAIEGTGLVGCLDGESTVVCDGSRVVYRTAAATGKTDYSIARVNGVCGMQPALRNTLRSDKMLHTFFDLLGADDIEHLIAQLHPKRAGDGICFPSHRDIDFRRVFDPNWVDVAGNGSYAICIIPLDRMTRENGGLYIDTNSFGNTEETSEETLLWVEADPGDLIFLHPYILHGSGPNESTTLNRRTLLTGYCAFGANHKAYPGAEVNTRFTRQRQDGDNIPGTITIRNSPWK